MGHCIKILYICNKWFLIVLGESRKPEKLWLDSVETKNPYSKDVKQIFFNVQ